MEFRPYRDEPMPVDLDADGRSSKSELLLDLLLASFVAHLQNRGVAGACLSYLAQHARREAPWHLLYFLPLPHGHGWLRPILPTSGIYHIRGQAVSLTGG